MHKNILLKKALVVGIILLFIGTSITSSTSRIDRVICQTSNFDGSLLGYVNDTFGNPIEGALVRVHFHETYEEDYSDSAGFYHVTNIPICWCMKNATCSKEGYQTEWVLLSIAENTTHDFFLESDNHPPDAPKIKGKVHIDKVGILYDYKFKATDPDGDDVRYFIDWDDGTSEWTDYYTSGEEITRNHTWIAMGTVSLRARANDTYGALGPWGYLQWSISKEDDCNCNDEFDDNDKFERPICGFLQLLIAYFLKFSDIFDELAWNDRPYPRPFQNIFLRLSEIMDGKASAIIDFGASIDCWDYPYP